MAISMYTASVPVLVRALGNLRAVLAKGDAHCAARKIEPSAFIGARLYPDMFPLARQVQIACDMAKGCAARLTGVDAPPRPDTETTFAELVARIDWTVDYLQSFKPESFEGAEARAIVLKLPRNEYHFTGEQYLNAFVLPNLYFHSTIAYALLREGGVELGKFDFLGSF